MTEETVAGVDWAGGYWLGVVFEGDEYKECLLEREFEGIFESEDFDNVLVDIPIGLPDEEHLKDREEVDSAARQVCGRSSSVFPVPSRRATNLAYEHWPVSESEEYKSTQELYEAVVERNEADIGKGLSWQSFYIAPAIGEVDAFLQSDQSLSELVVESHPEVCFSGLMGEPLSHAKDSAAGVGERLSALQKLIDDPGEVLNGVTQDILANADQDSIEDVTIDDVLDAIVMGVVAQKPRGQLTPEQKQAARDKEGLPMQIVYLNNQ